MVTKQHRSRRAALAALTTELRADGWTWGSIAALVQREQRVNARVAMRLARGWSQQTVADRWNAMFPDADGERPMTAKKLSYWETWPESGREPSLSALRRLAQVYECDPRDLIDSDTPSGAALTEAPQPVPTALAATVIHQLRPLTTGPVSARQRDAAFGQLIQFLSTWGRSMERRNILHMLGWAAIAAAAAPPAAALDPEEEARVLGTVLQPGRVDASVLDHMEEVLRLAEQDEHRRGPHAALDTVLAQRNLSRVILDHCPSALRPRVLSVHAEASRLAGWLSFDLNDFDGAGYYYEHARATAHEAENTELGARVLCMMSYLATWRGQPRIGIDHAVAAQAWAARTDDDALRGFAVDVAARAYGANGDYDECLRSLDEAHHYLTIASGSSSPVFHVYDAADGQGGIALLAGIRGKCLVDLDRPREAVAATEEGLQHMGQNRPVALSKIDLGLALTRMGEIEGAAMAIGEAAELAGRNRSGRALERLHAAAAQLEPWSGTPAVRDLRERLAVHSA
ncbi:hypothetical protein [Streptomyces sp. URMC 129]|uniref:hypothetical protein n=1 Tax=Streptomyces sp. URMC 129 TaxID=3423407 RepID=UPI003F1D7448